MTLGEFEELSLPSTGLPKWVYHVSNGYVNRQLQCLLVDSRDGAGFTADSGSAKVRLVLGLSSDCSLRLLKLGVRFVVLVGVGGGTSPSKVLGRSLLSQNSFLSSPSRLRMLHATRAM